jgi:hypothetical protein
MPIRRLEAAPRRISVSEKAAMLQNLQKQGWLNPSQTKQVKDLFVETTGKDLETLKRAVDHAGAVNGWLGGRGLDLRQLIEHDIRDPDARAAIKGHFTTEAKPSKEVVVYSDIDDTLVSKLNDPRFPKGTVYPGARAFLTALDQGATATDVPGDVVFLTARPRFLERKTHQFLSEVGLAPAAVLEGRLRDSLTFDTSERFQRYADRKVNGYITHQSYFPERQGVFVGDNGQGDALAAEALNRLDPSQRPKASYIHNVLGMKSEAKAELEQRGVVLFDTYLDAAVDAFEKGLISRQALTTVRTETRREFNSLTTLSVEQRNAVEALLARAEARESAVPG